MTYEINAWVHCNGVWKGDTFTRGRKVACGTAFRIRLKGLEEFNPETVEYRIAAHGWTRVEDKHFCPHHS
jgi:hypothetical protein